MDNGIEQFFTYVNKIYCKRINALGYISYSECELKKSIGEHQAGEIVPIIEWKDEILKLFFWEDEDNPDDVKDVSEDYRIVLTASPVKKQNNYQPEWGGIKPPKCCIKEQLNQPCKWHG